eukprot:m.340494 g.340494  ORF g.340494 m.340494 type:complete len:736 (+) comp16105_c0_seq3:180-2387(+)
MGIRDLQGLVQSNCDYLQRVCRWTPDSDVKPTFVVDGDGFKFLMLKKTSMKIGGFDAVVDECRRYLHNLAVVSSGVIIVIDGARPGMKDDTNYRRQLDTCDAAIKAFQFLVDPESEPIRHRKTPPGSPCTGEWFFTVLLAVVKEVSDQTGVSVTVRQFRDEADHYIAHLAQTIHDKAVRDAVRSAADGGKRSRRGLPKQPHAVILAQDSDFFVYRSPFYVQFDGVVMSQDGSISGYGYVPAEIWKALGLSQAEAGVWASVIGNDYVPRHLDEGHKLVRLKWDKSTLSRPSKMRGQSGSQAWICFAAKTVASTCIAQIPQLNNNFMVPTIAEVEQLVQAVCPLFKHPPSQYPVAVESALQYLNIQPPHPHSVATLCERMEDPAFRYYDVREASSPYTCCTFCHVFSTLPRSMMKAVAFKLEEHEIFPTALTRKQQQQTPIIVAPRKSSSMQASEPVDTTKIVDPTTCLAEAAAEEAEEAIVEIKSRDIGPIVIMAADSGISISRTTSRLRLANVALGFAQVLYPRLFIATDWTIPLLDGTQQEAGEEGQSTPVLTLSDTTTSRVWHDVQSQKISLLQAACTIAGISTLDESFATHHLLTEVFLMLNLQAMFPESFEHLKNSLYTLLALNFHHPPGPYAGTGMLPEGSTLPPETTLPDTLHGIFSPLQWNSFVQWEVAAAQALTLLELCRLTPPYKTVMGTMDALRFKAVLTGQIPVSPQVNETLVVLKEAVESTLA